MPPRPALLSLRRRLEKSIPGMPPGWRRMLRRRRRALAALLAAAAVAAGVQAARPPDPVRADVVVAARDLLPGESVTASDVRIVSFPAPLAPPAALRDVADLPSRPLMSVIASGTPIDVRSFLAASTVTGWGAAAVAVPVRLADAAAAALIRAGDTIDIVAASSGTPARVVAARVRVLIPAAPAGAGLLSGAQDGALLVVVTDQRSATALAGAAATSRLSPVLR